MRFALGHVFTVPIGLKLRQSVHTMIRLLCVFCFVSCLAYSQTSDRERAHSLLDAALHIGQDDLPAPESRALIGPDRVLGLSTHNEAQLVASNEDAVDYIAIGPLFETGSKRNPDAVVGVKELARLRPMTGRPVVAIGGINRENCRSVLEAGADSVAVIGDLFPHGGTLKDLRERAEEWMRLTNE